MKKALKGTAISLIAIFIFMILPGCTPGKAQTRGNDYKGSFETEEFEAFDNGGSVNDDEIPPYRETRKVSNSGRENQSGKEYDNNIARIKKNYDRQNNSGEGYNNARGASYRETDSYDGRDYNSREDTDYADAGVDSEAFYQKGVASWYGREFHGRATASGEKFDMNNMTAAHKTLPFGTIVEVKNLDNGKAVRLKINDRGPYRGNRIIDVSYGAARHLDMVRSGEAKVGISVIKMGSSNAAAGSGYSSKYIEPVSDEEYPVRRVKSEGAYNYSDAGDIKLQAGAFYSRKNAENLKSRIEGITDKPVRIVQDGEFFKVRVEDIRSKSEMYRVKDSLSGDNISSFSVE
ncbi:MAG TPA: septal ring lytic transglycosylase RlpA family protein [Spirochaetota bacterium]|nr:septal ring lytic transglycosylase RlpA family protein [Spirochaetota bacterium]HPF04775.1 septal ring lytic transglycosylase RlpA family protein [Spirochaetota bacterium]HPJ41108.1 septal ring lytic transglycosylase RlpA family protein [Spirochaetota bacterium]HPR37699.1 septal ring lytic transglycosylase RlpA family protein [Spirochaetota bacterium]HRX46814.1 septal ring lytic transglycosylase RlpA family protein [Spirochaetota bacterium]